MNATRTLTFLWTPWSAAMSVGAVLLAAVLCGMAWRRSGYARAQGLLELLRLVIVSLVALIFNQPEWVEEFRPVENPMVAVLWDNSTSMETRDVPLDGGSGSAQTSRREAIANLTGEAAWTSLKDRLNVVLQPFTSPDSGSLTNLHEPLTQAPEKFRNLIGVVLISDGDWNEGPPPV